MHVTNTLTEYGIISKVLHWLSAAILFIQIPLGFYLVDLDFGDQRITIDPSIFKGQRFLAKMNHVLLYIAILSITISGILKKLFNGETLTILFKEIQINENFDLADQFYEIHILSNYTLIGLIVLHNDKQFQIFLISNNYKAKELKNLQSTLLVLPTMLKLHLQLKHSQLNSS